MKLHPLRKKVPQDIGFIKGTKKFALSPRAIHRDGFALTPQSERKRNETKRSPYLLRQGGRFDPIQFNSIQFKRNETMYSFLPAEAITGILAWLAMTVCPYEPLYQAGAIFCISSIIGFIGIPLSFKCHNDYTVLLSLLVTVLGFIILSSFPKEGGCSHTRSCYQLVALQNCEAEMESSGSDDEDGRSSWAVPCLTSAPVGGTATNCGQLNW